ncbi:MAG: hypothetical protein ACLQGP_30180 [Isosphaeraceae bacterium]
MTKQDETKADDPVTSNPSDETPSAPAEPDSKRELTDEEMSAVTGGAPGIVITGGNPTPVGD